MRTASPDAIVCLGDVASDGPDPVAVIADLCTLNASFILGNADEVILDPTKASTSSNPDIAKFQAMWQWGNAQLSEDDKAFIRTFQPTIAMPFGNDLTMLCYHGSPRSNVEAIRATTPDSELDAYFEGHLARIMVGGHTHQAFFRRHRQHWVINPGSIGLPFEWSVQHNGMINPARAEYAILTWHAGQWNVDFRVVPFHLATFTTRVRQSGMPYTDWLLIDWHAG
jgi:predicted phosphodiesterase